ncbi:MAG TPA: hypothetical protein PKD55_13235 [Bellilinea sp.]|nr:hypothetical protein [Bellilinea sp.]
MINLSTQDKTLLASAIAFFCISLNCTGSLLFYDASYRILYLDMVGTMISAIILGPAWGVMVGILTNFLSSFFLDPSFRCFSVVNVVGALYWGYLAHRGWLSLPRSTEASGLYRMTPLWVIWKGVIVSGIVAGMVTSLPASILQRWLFNYDTGSSSSYLTRYSKQHFDLMINLNQNLGEYPCDLFIDFALSVPDKLLTSFLAIMFCITFLRYYAGRMIGSSFTSSWLVDKKNFFLSHDALPCYISTIVYVYSLITLPNLLLDKIIKEPVLIIIIALPLLYNATVIFYSIKRSISFSVENPILIESQEMLNFPNWKTLSIIIMIIGGVLVSVCIGYLYIVNVVFNSDIKHIYYKEIAQFNSVEDILKITNFYKTTIPPLLLMFSYIFLEFWNSRVLVMLEKHAQAKMVRWFSHNISYKVSDVRAFFRDLSKFLTRNQLESVPFQQVYYDGMKVDSIGDVTNGSSANAARIERALKILKHMTTDSGDSPRAANVKDIILKAAEPFKRKFQIEVIGQIYEQCVVYEEYLAQVIDNLLMNALNHAFIPVTRDSRVVFLLDETSDSLSIDYCNNGRPLPSGFSKEKFFDFEKKLSVSSNEGLGGAFIGFVVEKVHRGSFEIINNPDYNVNFRITIPKEGHYDA